MTQSLTTFKFQPSKRLSLFENTSEFENDDFYLEEFHIDGKYPHKTYRICEKKLFHDWADSVNVSYIYEEKNLRDVLTTYYEKKNK